MSCTTAIQIDDALMREFGDFKKGRLAQWVALKLDGKDLNNAVCVKKGDAESFEEFVRFVVFVASVFRCRACQFKRLFFRARSNKEAFPAEQPRFCFFNLSYDLGLDGKRTKVNRKIVSKRKKTNAKRKLTKKNLLTIQTLFSDCVL